MDLNSIYSVVCYLLFGLVGNADIKNVTMITVENKKMGEIGLDLTKYKSRGISVWEYDTNDFSIKVDDDLIEHLNLLYKLLGIDMTWGKYCSLTKSEIKSLNRDLKINKIIKD
jgi:hypothetical protein